MRHAVFLLLILSLLALLPGCKRTPKLEPLPAGSVILAFGDSLTYGTGAAEGEGYPDALARILGVRVVNAGVPGELTAQGVERLPGVLAEIEPQLVIICHGGNDILQRRSALELEANIRKMVEIVQQSGAQVLLVGVPQPSMILRSIPLYSRVSWDMNAALEEHALPKILEKPELKADPIHPNGAGYASLAETLAKRIRKVLP